MKITNINKGESYQVDEDLRIEIERTNPFFNDYGEHTQTVSMPATPRNCQLLGHPELPGAGGRQKMFDALIQHGSYSFRCRQMVISARKNASIESSFLINDGSFYSRVKDVRIQEILADEEVDGVDTVDAAIGFCRSLWDNTDPRMGICTVMVTDDSDMQTVPYLKDKRKGYDFKLVNAYGRKDDTETSMLPYVWHATGGQLEFYNEVMRQEYVGGTLVNLDKGYYITPYLRAAWLLRRVLSHFGYSLKESVFDLDTDLSGMLLLHTNIDTIVDGHIRLRDLVPDVTAGDYLELFRKKFCCEFVTDEDTMTVEAIFFKDVCGTLPAVSIDQWMTSMPEYGYKEESEYRRIVLKPEERLDGSGSYDNLTSLLGENPQAYQHRDGNIYKDGFRYNEQSLEYGGYAVMTLLAGAGCPYDSGEDMDTQEVEIPETVPEMRELYAGGSTFLYIGDATSAKSKVVDNQEVQASASATEDTAKATRMMLAMTANISGRTFASVSPYIPVRIDDICQRTFGHSLCYNGELGIYETWWKDYDIMLRNCLEETRVEVMLPDRMKHLMRGHEKVSMLGIPYFVNRMTIEIGVSEGPGEIELLSSQMTWPRSEPSGRLVIPPLGVSSFYRWKLKSEKLTDVSEEEKKQYTEGMNYGGVGTIVYPDIPQAAYLGKKMYARYVVVGKQWTETFDVYAVWLECVNT